MGATYIDIWSDNWIPREKGMRTYTPNLLGLTNAPVATLIDTTHGCWDINALGDIFWDEDVAHILKIPVSNTNYEDVRVWNFTKHGFYYVRSAYYIAQEMIKELHQNKTGSSSRVDSPDLNWIWQLRVPNKIKVFVWRFVKHSLPVFTALSRRGIDINTCCPVCKMSCETLPHLFRDCDYARLYWALTPFSS